MEGLLHEQAPLHLHRGFRETRRGGEEAGQGVGARPQCLGRALEGAEGGVLVAEGIHADPPFEEVGMVTGQDLAETAAEEDAGAEFGHAGVGGRAVRRGPPGTRPAPRTGAPRARRGRGRGCRS